MPCGGSASLASEQKLAEALHRAGKSAERLQEELRRLGQFTITDQREALALCSVLSDFPFLVGDGRPDKSSSLGPLHSLVALFQQVTDEESLETLTKQGVPELIRIFDQRAFLPPARSDEFLFILKVLAMYRVREGTDRVIHALREGYEPDAFLWPIVLAQFESGHPDAIYLVEKVRDIFPRKDFTSIGFLDLSNQLTAEGVLHQHPFDTDTGIAFLEDILRDADPEKASYAQSAVISLPFVTEPARGRLLGLAHQYADPTVELEVLSVGAKLGIGEDIRRLSELCRDPKLSASARAYLNDLGLEQHVPAEARDPDFEALAEMCRWLAHPMEYGSPPDDVELYDSRTLFWPPTGDRRRLWLVAYRYRGEKDKSGDAGIGMVGSVTWAMVDEATPRPPPEDIYALHCWWELQAPDAPETPLDERIPAGRAILAQRNAGF
jgi:hypothetical protein